MTLPAKLLAAHEARIAKKHRLARKLKERLDEGECLKRAAYAVGVSYTTGKRYRRMMEAA